MGINEVQNAKSLELMASQGERKVASVDRSTSFSKIFGDTQLKCPYSHLAKDGLIEYNGVVFVCDYKRNSICLGDVSDSKNVLNISLPSGGNLKVNVDNLGDLSKAAGMFTPADLNAIMRAIAQYNHCTKKLNELDEEEIETVENVTDALSGMDNQLFVSQYMLQLPDKKQLEEFLIKQMDELGME